MCESGAGIALLPALAPGSGRAGLPLQTFPPPETGDLLLPPGAPGSDTEAPADPALCHGISCPLLLGCSCTPWAAVLPSCPLLASYFLVDTYSAQLQLLSVQLAVL